LPVRLGATAASVEPSPEGAVFSECSGLRCHDGGVGAWRSKPPSGKAPRAVGLVGNIVAAICKHVIMQVGAPLQATRVKHMRSRLRRPRSRAVVDRQRKFSRSVLVQCALYCEDHGRRLMAYALCGIARAGLSKRDPVEALSNGGLLRNFSRGTLEAGISHGAAPAAVLGSA
jgi:hypothetical protein